MARLSHYAASKWGLTGLSKSWAIELAGPGARYVTGTTLVIDAGLLTR